MLEQLKAFFICLLSGVPPYGVGEPGIAKTRTTEAFARFLKLAYECVIGSQRLPEDVLGAPKVVERKDRAGNICHVMEHAVPAWRFNLVNSDRGGILHLDELGDCQPAMQAAMLQILADGLPNTFICATGNPIEISTNGYELSLPAINRLCQIEWPEDRARWRKGMLKGWDSLGEDFPVLDPKWRDNLPATKALIVSYIDRNAAQFQSMPQEQNGVISPWPSMRSWTNVATVLAAARSVGAEEDVEDILVKGCVGEGAAISFRNWVKTLDLPDPEDLLADPSKYKPSARGDLAFAVLCSVVAAVLRENTLDRWLAGWKVVEKQCDKAVDVAAAVCGPLAQNRPKKNGKPAPIPKAVEKRLFPVLQQSS